MTITTHRLEFFSAPDPLDLIQGLKRFQVGTCGGQWLATQDEYVIFAVANNLPGNGHFEDVLEWFYSSCQRDGKNLLIFEFLNTGFFKHLVNKRGFTPLGNKNNACVKVFFPAKFKLLQKHGNEYVDRKGRSRL
jgi:hypothetical protein